ncbi:MAG: hypothetical protein J6A85_06990 [Clostridia bacterium]|nr:hypothetical protein [Clostridia bacterium]
MDKRKVIYYTDELNDEFSVAQITPRKIDGSYKYIHTSPFKRLTHFFWYRIVATPCAFLYTKVVFGHTAVGKEKLKKYEKIGYFIYGNHTQIIGDAFIPSMLNFPKENYVIVHPNNVSMPFLGRVTPSMGALPIPDGMDGYKNFLNAIETRIKQNHAVVIYPEAHIWPYYTGIRPFKDTSFSYPVKLGRPVFCFTNTYQKPAFGKEPKIVTYIDGPFFPDSSLPFREQKKQLRDQVYNAMCRRAESSTEVCINYIKEEKDNG